MSRRTLIVSGLGCLYAFRSGEARNPILRRLRKVGCFHGRNRGRWNGGGTAGKNWNVSSRRNCQLYDTFSARPFIELLQPLSQSMSFNTCDGVFPGDERGLGAGKYFRGNVVLGKLTTLTPEILLTDIVQKIGESGRSAKRFRDRLKFLPFCFGGCLLGVCLHDPGPWRSGSLSQHWIIQSLARGLQRRLLYRGPRVIH